MSAGGYLLDTHALVWAMSDPERLGPDARRVIADPATSLVVSAASAWELSTKHRLGKLPQAEPLLLGFGRLVAVLGAIDLGISSAHAVLAGSLDWDHRDPFDRMLAAQAIHEQLVLVSRDDSFGGLTTLALMW